MKLPTEKLSGQIERQLKVQVNPPCLSWARPDLGPQLQDESQYQPEDVADLQRKATAHLTSLFADNDLAIIHRRYHEEQTRLMAMLEGRLS